MIDWVSLRRYVLASLLRDRLYRFSLLAATEVVHLLNARIAPFSFRSWLLLSSDPPCFPI
jgi:hypothetical protein